MVWKNCINEFIWHEKIKSEDYSTLELFYLHKPGRKSMYQAALFTQDTLDKHTIQGNNMKAIFEEKDEGKYDVVLEINSHKFLISMKPGWNSLEEFEVVAVKGFVEYSYDVMQALKNIVSDVCYGQVQEAY